MNNGNHYTRIESFILFSCSTHVSMPCSLYAIQTLLWGMAFTIYFWAFPWYWWWSYLGMLQTLKSIGSHPLKATAQYIWLFHLFYLFWEVPILQKFFFKTSDLHVVRYHIISATLGFNDTQPLQCDDLAFPSISHHCISLSWNRDLNEDTLQTKNYPNHHFAGYFAASLTHSF